MPSFKKKRIKLNLSEEESLFIGIVSSEYDYRLVWAINKNIGLSFQQSISHNSFTSGTIQKTKYTYETQSPYQLLELLQNRYESQYLISELKQYDYIIKLFGEFETEELSKFVKELRLIESIQGAYLIDTEKLKKSPAIFF